MLLLQNMNISLGISPSDSAFIQSYINAGVNEFFVGYIDKRWINTFGWEVSLNRRQWPGASYSNLKELQEIVNLIHKNNKKIFLTINEHDYSEKEVNLILKMIKEIKPIPIDAFIISSLSLMTKLRNVGIDTPFHISIGGGCNNIEAIKFYKNNISNITRYILPRKLTIEEITLIAQQSQIEKVELEAFIMRESCVWNDEYCFSWHSKNCKKLCSYVQKFSQIELIYPLVEWKKDLFSHRKVYKKFQQLAISANKEIQVFPTKLKPDSLVTKIFSNTPYHSCGLCVIPIFKKIGISTIKIPGRGNLIDINYLKLVKTILDKVGATPKYCQNLLGIKELCYGQNCYYNFPFN